MIVTSTWPTGSSGSTTARSERKCAMDRRWLPGQELTSPARYRLFCLPYAGGAAAIYRSWRHAAPSHIQVCALELPGRGSRLRETPYSSLEPLVKELAVSLGGALDQPFALFGHSMG